MTARDAFTGAEVDVEFESEWQHATALGEAVWRRMASRKGLDYKDPEYAAAHAEVVELVRGAAVVIEREGFDGLAEYLDREERYESDDVQDVQVSRSLA